MGKKVLRFLIFNIGFSENIFLCLSCLSSDEISKDFVNSETLILLSTIFPFLSTVIKSLTVGKNLYLLFSGGRHASSPFV